MESTLQTRLELPEGFPDTTRVWIYQSDRTLTPEEEKALNAQLTTFTEGWTAHNHQLRASGRVYFHRFVCLFADELHAGASGCSIDSSVRFIQGLEAALGLSLTHRMLMAYVHGEEVRTRNLQQLSDALKSGDIDPDALVFNNLVSTLGDMRSQWMVPLKDSWHMRFA